MSNFSWNALLLSHQQIQEIPPERLGHAAESVSTQITNLACGISAIGNLLACTASNGDTGLCTDAATSLGWLLESLGELTAALANKGEILNEEVIRNIETPVKVKREKEDQQ